MSSVDDFSLIYNRLIASQKLNSDNAYERLAAVVFFLLLNATTVHDLRLVGSSGVKHQIDVTAGSASATRRVLIECKNYGKPVGLPLVRNFFGAVEDIGPDEAFMVTTRRYTAPAVRYAAAKGIRLAILGPPQDEDLNGTVQRVIIEINATVPYGEPTVEWVTQDDPPPNFPVGRRIDITEMELADASREPLPLRQMIEDAIGQAVPLGGEGEFNGHVELAGGASLSVGGSSPLKVSGFNWKQNWGVITERVETGTGINGLAAELVLRTLDGDIHRVFSNKVLAEWSLDDLGRVVPKS